LLDSLLQESPSMPWGSAPKCPGCDRTVYPMEQIIAADRKPFHVKCITCQMQGCRNDLTARTLHKYEGCNICTSCHETIFRQRQYGPGEGGETIEQRKAREEAERLEAEAREKAKRERRCPECNNKTFGEDSEMLAPDLYYHRGCIKCSLCSCSPGENVPIVMAARPSDDVFAPEILDPYCNVCYAKQFHTSAFKIAETVTVAPELGFLL